ncbi:HAMP domain-containing protein [Pradoshia sp. D12]|uniref:sensor histidine kinase n=1 Tax=Bacillaceae TaxID=186817 RepID=UPI00112CFB5F|nr:MULTISPECIES: histidine kinase [Bacillaceae]QFK71468.1 HAMP domain-containing protein [Pradoshia sp. D12]TPF73263.1 HAMP domain-containing protein [Bacillus sp. D12]
MKFKERFTQNVFNRLFLISSITIVVTVIILFVTVSNYYSDIIIQKEVNINTRTLERVEDYFSSKDADINRAIRDLYINGEMINDITFALNNGYGKYLEYHLDRFSKSKSFTPNNIDIYFNGYFSQDSDLNAISLRSYENQSIEYLLINNNVRWNKSVIDLGTNADPSLSQGIPNLNRDGLLKERKLRNTITKRIILNNPVTLKKIGEISFYYSTEWLDKMLRKQEGAPVSFFLIDRNGEIAYSVNKGIPIDMIREVKRETNETKIEWKQENYHINTIANMGEFTYISVIPDKGWQKLTIIRGTMWVVICFLILAAILITFSFTRNYSRRIQNIVKIVRKVENGDLNARIPISKQEDELSKISININSMLTELNKYIEQSYLLNMKQQQAELKALQAQIDPHFLFNTLEAIRMVAVVEGSKTSSKMIFHLSKLFRYTLESKDTVPLYTEIRYVNQYLKLMQFKYPDKLSVDINIPNEVEQTMVQKLILQPIIENYFAHGFKKNQFNNELLILAHQVGEKIDIIVKDNGKGMSEDKLDIIVQHINHEEGDGVKSIGLRNIHQRLKLKYGDQFGISLTSIKDQGTTVKLSIPVQEIKHV